MLKTSFLENTMPKKNKGIVIVSKEEAFWINIVNHLKQDIEGAENTLKYQKNCLLMATAKLLKAKRLSKK